MIELTVHQVAEKIIVRISGCLSQVVLEIIPPVTILVSGSIRKVGSYLLVCIVQKPPESNLAVSRGRQIGVIHRPGDTPLGKNLGPRNDQQPDRQECKEFQFQSPLGFPLPCE